ncbi:glycoside hydrolase family 13 protein [Brachybacterium sp. YJGR34]|uniref:glycoside hydrolase family 13 protein n=1 Tax=Brachybacterium sp. YJGR34 TaxID=2059911 RepID=UPI000E0C1ABF|nr:glycoside hydrolase family 13 protein [Brachybacterium sp. YJGR34]
MTAPRPTPAPDHTAVPLLEQPHHDGGPVHVTPSATVPLGERVRLRVHVPAAYPARTVALRAVVDGEILTRTLEVEEPGGEADDDRGRWLTTTLAADSPVVPYRFCVLAAPGARTASGAQAPAYAWLTAAGLVPWDVADATDFRLVAHEPAPDWVADAIVYQVFPDRFARSAAAATDPDGRPTGPGGAALPDWAIPMAWDEEPAVHGELTGRQHYGGDLDGVIEHLDHIASLGADTVYLTPVFPAGSVHRYDASTFERVDPLLGGDEALVRLSRALHARGMRLLLDLTTNHTGDGHEWFRAARADAGGEEAGFYLFEDGPDGTGGHPDSYVSWLDVPSLPKLDHRDETLRSRLLRGADSVVGRYLAEPFAADGWRIDVANMTGRHGATDLAHRVARDLRATQREVARRTGRGTWLLAEHGHDASGDLAGDGWHGTMNYSGFTRPLWAWLAAEETDLNWLGLPLTIPRLDGGAIWRTLRDYNAQLPWPARLHSQNQLASHDTPRTRTVVGSRERQLVAIAALATLPGVPTVFAGDELGAEGTTGEHSRTPMPWAALDPARAEPAGPVDREVLARTRALLGLRRAEVSLRRGGLRWLHVGPEAITFARTHPAGDTVVHLARAAHEEISLDLAVPGLDAPGVRHLRHRVGPLAAHRTGTALTLRADGPGAVVLTSTPPPEGSA